MNVLPDYWLERPSLKLSRAMKANFDRLLETILSANDPTVLEYSLKAPKWQFLCYAAEHYPLALHGSNNPAIAHFEPRQSNDLNEFGNQQAVYAASDGIWAMFFAVVDRERVASITNACIRIKDASGQVAGPFYFFSVSRAALAQRPWREGSVYLLPRETFITQPPMQLGENEVHIAQLASFTGVRPLARLAIAPEDFPYLSQVRGHDDTRLQEYADALQTGAPWPD